MLWILLIIIVAILILKSILSEDEKKKSPPSPPTDDVYILGCCGAVNCGYWSPEFAKGSDGQIVMNAEKCYCAYKKNGLKNSVNAHLRRNIRIYLFIVPSEMIDGFFLAHNRRVYTIENLIRRKLYEVRST